MKRKLSERQLHKKLNKYVEDNQAKILCDIRNNLVDKFKEHDIDIDLIEQAQVSIATGVYFTTIGMILYDHTSHGDDCEVKKFIVDYLIEQLNHFSEQMELGIMAIKAR